jgi:hypothetical protein
MATSHVTQIERLEERLKQLKAREARQQARRRVLSSRRERKDDTRRKILVGAIVLTKVQQGVLDQALLTHWLEGALTRPEDRALFELGKHST